MEPVLPVPTVETKQPPESTNEPKAALTPPTSEEWNKENETGTDELSELDLEEDEDEIEPDHYYSGGRIPVFKPTMDQFRDFQKFIDKIDKYGMKSGIVKVIPPQEWRESLPALDQAVKTIKVKNPITQEFAGSHGTYTQANIEKQRSYNLPQWQGLTEEPQHQPPAKRGEKRKNQERTARPAHRPRPPPSADMADSPPMRRRPGRPPKKKPPPPISISKPEDAEDDSTLQAPPTPTSPVAQSKSRPVGRPKRQSTDALAVEVKQEDGVEERKPSKEKSRGRQPRMMTISERRKYNRQEKVEEIDEAAFEDFDYRFNAEEFTPERCAELEEKYWKSLTFAPPIYGADMPGSLFNDSTSSWNVAKLPNLLDVLGQKVPGVNTAYLYLGMWKATFAWHLEDVDLYSINYIHFGAPKQWYSISQEDARRFENAMRSIWPSDAKHCSQFLRHKTYLISPALLKSQFNIEVNRLVHYEGEFVITYPYGYHSGYNLGYNCAESVNFATEAWLDYGKIAKKCECEADSVWINVEDIERRLRGEPTPEYYEETDDEAGMDEIVTDLPSPPASVVARKPKASGRKRKRDSGAVLAEPEKPAKKIKIRIRTASFEPCVLCPNSLPSEPLLPTDNGRHAHRVCALFTPETYLSEDNGVETVMGVANIDKARLDLKCSFCRSKKGACFQCSSRKCTRAYHATCAAPGGVQVEYGPTPVYGEDGTEYVTDGYDFRCRFHRPKRPKNLTIEALEMSALIKKFAKTLQQRDTVQAQYLQGDVFAGTVVENRPAERAVILDILPEGDRVEVDWKYLTVLDPADSQLPKPSADAKPLPAHMYGPAATSRNLEYGPPIEGDHFCDPAASHKWAEFHTAPAPHNSAQVKVNLEKDNQIWFYLGKTSTEARAQFTESIGKQVCNPTGNFLETVKAATSSQHQPPRSTIANTHRVSIKSNTSSGTPVLSRQPSQNQSDSNAKPYQYKPKPDPSSKSAVSRRKSTTNHASKQPPSLGHTNHHSPLSNSNGTQRRGSWLAGQSSFPTQPLSGSSMTGLMTKSSPLSLAGSTVEPLSLPQQWNNSGLTKTSVSWAPYKTSFQALQATSKMAMPAPIAAMPLVSADLPLADSRPSADWIQSSKDYEFVKRIQPYRYLVNSYCRRPKEYKSPYCTDGGFSSEYAKILPNKDSSAEPQPQMSVYQECAIPLAAFKPALVSFQQQQQQQQKQHQQSSKDPSFLLSAVSSQQTPAVGLEEHQITEFHSLSNTYKSRSLPTHGQHQTPAQFEEQMRHEQQQQRAKGSTSYDRLLAQIASSARQSSGPSELESQTNLGGPNGVRYSEAAVRPEECRNDNGEALPNGASDEQYDV